MGSALRRCRRSVAPARLSCKVVVVGHRGWMKESDVLLSRAEKLRRDARRVRNEATRLSNAGDQRRMLDIAQTLETDARDLEARARRDTTAP